MKAFRFVSRPFALRAFLFLALVTPIAWLSANSGAITNGITGRVPMHHFFRNQANGATIVINRGFYAIINITYAGESVWKDNKMPGPVRTSFSTGSTSPLDWYQTIAVRIDSYRADTNQKIDTFNWSGKLSQDPGVGFSYSCKEIPGNNQTPVQVAFRFYYLGGVDPASKSVTVYVK